VPNNAKVKLNFKKITIVKLSNSKRVRTLANELTDIIPNNRKGL